MAGVNEMAFRLYRVAGRHAAILFCDSRFVISNWSIFEITRSRPPTRRSQIANRKSQITNHKSQITNQDSTPLVRLAPGCGHRPEAASGEMQRDCLSAFWCELVADAPHGLQEARRVGLVLEVFAQADDEVVDRAGVGLLVQSPD